MSVETDKVGHILVVDDDAMVRQTITNYLEQQSVPGLEPPPRKGTSQSDPTGFAARQRRRTGRLEGDPVSFRRPYYQHDRPQP
jgi:CheY-like chemotaxis protein